MHTDDIRLGMKYVRDDAGTGGGVKAVYRFTERRNGTRAVSWKRLGGVGHRHGVSLVKTFAAWAQRCEPLTADEAEGLTRLADNLAVSS